MRGRSVSLDVQYFQATDTQAAQITSQTSQEGNGGAEGTTPPTEAIEPGKEVALSNAPFYVSSTAAHIASRKSGRFYFYDAKLINGRYRITNSVDRCGKLPIGQNVTGWVPAEYCQGKQTGSVRPPGAGIANAVSRQAQEKGRQIGEILEELSYTDCAADYSDNIEITITATDARWLKEYFPKKGSRIIASIMGRNWEKDGDQKKLPCGSFVLDDISYRDSPSIMQVGGVSKPSNTDFDELERAYAWKDISIKRIGETIAGRYGLEFAYQAEDFEVDYEEQDDTDSSFYNGLCKKYGLVLKVYSGKLWVYDREKFKAGPATINIRRGEIIRGSLSYSTSLHGIYTGGYFAYTDPDTDSDIACSVGGGSHTKNLSQRATSVYDASVQLCAAINNANHGAEKLRFRTPGSFMLHAATNIQISGYGGLDGKYFIDRITHRVSRSGFESTVECSKVGVSFGSWMAGGGVTYQQNAEQSQEQYQSNYETVSPAAAGANAGEKAGTPITLDNAPIYQSSTAANAAGSRSGIFYYYDGIMVNGRYRVTNSAGRCGKLPVGKNVTGWVSAGDCKGNGKISASGR